MSAPADRLEAEPIERQWTPRDFGGASRPTLADWLKPPMNTWAFRHARELFRSERVGAPPAGTLTLPATAGPGVGASLASYLERSHTDALVVLHQGGLALEWYAPQVAPDDRHILFSVTKSVIGLVASALIAEGLVDEAAPVAVYIPEAGDGYADATVRNLLDMTANVRFTEDYDGPDMRRYREAAGQLPSSRNMGTHEYVAGLPSDGDHGLAFKYVSPTTDMAAWVCERATGQSLAQLITHYVWEPMGAECEADLLLDRYGAARAGGGLCATARDMARIGQLLVHDGLGGASRQAAADVKQAGKPDEWSTGSLAAFLPNAAYRNFWYQPEGDPGTFLAAGIYGQRIYVDVPREVVIAQQSSLPDSFDQTTWSETVPTFRSIARGFDAG